jgi:hypothetical protein
MLSCTLLFAQNEEKYSITTQLFLQEQAGKIDLDAQTKASATEKRLGLHHVKDKKMRKYDRFVAAPDTIDGQIYMSAFVHLKDNAALADLEALGVQVQTKFGKGRITALIPVEKVEQVAALDNVTKIKAAQMMRPATTAARQKTNVDDILTQSADAISAGLDKVYDGSGVILGVIDTGIDFNHIAFKDKDGNSRIKQAYIYNGSTERTYTGSSITSSLTDDNTEDHGTHTSSIAGGSSVTVNDSTVSVTDDHASAAYGGMAPGADLFLAGVNGLSDTYMTNALNAMITYADNQGKPLVVSNSWGSHLGPHDGTGEWADLVAQHFGDSHPNRVILFAASNDADHEQGGIFATGTSSSANPFGAIIRSHYYSDTDDGYYYSGIIANAWANTTGSLTCNVYVLNKSTGAILATATVTPSTKGASVSDLSSYYSGSLYAYKNYVSAEGKTQVMLYTNELETRSADSNYTLAFELYPTNGSTTINAWADGYAYFYNMGLTTNGHTWTNGTSDMSASDEATIPNAISIGAYVSRTDWRSAAGTAYTSTGEYTMDDIAPFSSYALASKSPTGLAYPWISAPGARLAAAVNHNHTTSVDDYSYYGDNFITDLVVNSSTNPYAMMEGTSMATPAAAGIVALWLQASMEEGAAHKNLTVNDVKNIMRETAINDAFTTTGANASHFGNGKIDALAGIQYILGVSGGPTIKATPTTVTFDTNTYATRSYTKTVNVRGMSLEAGITATLTDANGVYSIDKSSITLAQAGDGVDITITYAPQAAGTHNATITLTSTGADDVVVNITATAKPADPFIMADPETLSFSADINASQTLSVEVMSEFLTDDITLTLSDANGVFTLGSSTITKAASEEGASFDVVFNAPATEGSYTGTITLSSPGADDVVVTLSATANDGGKASDAFLNIAKYATIDEAGWRTALVNNLYQYTEYKSDGVAWLTLPVYGAFVGARYATNSSTIGSGHPQAWIECDLDNNNTYGGTTWTNTSSATSPFNGSSAYFTGTSGAGAPRALGYNFNSNTEIRTVSFYVTHTTAVMLSGTGRNGSSADYPARLRIYECTKNGNTLTTSSTATVNQTSSSTSAFTLSSGTLDATKIYKVETSIYRGYLYEVAFKTPLASDPELTVSPTVLTFTANVEKTDVKSFTVTGTNLTNNTVTATLNDANGVFSLDKNSVSTSGTFNVTFAPTAAGSYTGTVTLSNNGAESKTVTLTATATAPELVVDESLTITTIAGTPKTGTFEILGDKLNGNVTLTLNDANGVFALSSSTATKAEAEEGKTFTVTFSPEAEGTYEATVTVQTEGLADQSVTLTGVASKGWVDVAVGKYGLTTLYTDVPLEIPDDEDLLGVFYAYDMSGGEVRLKSIRNSFEAETGVIIMANQGTYRFPVATGTVKTVSDNILQGSLEPLATSSIGGNVLTLGMGSNGYIGFYKFTGATLAAGKVYLVEPTGEAKAMSLVVDNFDGTATAIASITGKAEEQKDEWFTLQGVRLDGKPTGKGVFIHNGRKELVK